MKMSISASDISSFFAKSMSNLDRNIKMKDFVSRSRKRFPFRLKIMYFPHGNIFENDAMELFKASGVNMNGYRREKIDGAPFNKKELKYAKYIGRPETAFEASDGVELTSYLGLPLTLKSRPDGITNTHVIELKCPIGSLYTNEGKPTIPRQYKMQMIVEMLCHNRQKAYFLQYYQPLGWYSFVKNMVNQYNEDKIDINTTVYKPWRSPDEHVTNIINAVNKKVDPNKFYNYCIKTVGRFEIKGDKAEIDLRYSDIVLNLLRLTTPERLREFFNEYDTEVIMQTLSFGKDYKCGVVKGYSNNNIIVEWEGQINRDGVLLDNHIETMTIERFKAGYVYMIKDIMQTINSKSVAWESWARDISSSNPSLSELPPVDNGKYVLCEMEYPNNIRPYLEQFLQALKNKDIPSGSRRMKYFDDLASFLDSIPFKVIKEGEKQVVGQKKIESLSLEEREEKLENLRKRVGEKLEELKKANKIAFEYKDCFMDYKENRERKEELDKREEEIKRKEQILERNKKRMQDEWDTVTKLRREYEKKIDEKPRKKPRLEERKEKPKNDQEFIRDFFGLNEFNSLKL